MLQYLLFSCGHTLVHGSFVTQFKKRFSMIFYYYFFQFETPRIDRASRSIHIYVYVDASIYIVLRYRGFLSCVCKKSLYFKVKYIVSVHQSWWYNIYVYFFLKEALKLLRVDQAHSPINIIDKFDKSFTTMIALG